MTTSFKKRESSSAAPIPPRGSRPSLHNAQLLVSSGVPSLDIFLGGGLAAGSILLVEESSTAYSRQVVKMFLAEGVACGHSIFLASADEDPDQLLKSLPVPMGEEGTRKSGTVPDSNPTVPFSKSGQFETADQMSIAWRYQNMPEVQQSSFSNRFGHVFDLTSCVDPAKLASVDTTTFDVSQQLEARTSGELYRALKSRIQSKIEDGKFSVDSKHPPQQRNILRIALPSFGSPLWLDSRLEEPTSSSSCPSSLSFPTIHEFVYTLRGLLRRAYAVAIITISTALIPERGYWSYWGRMRRLCDTVVEMRSYGGNQEQTDATGGLMLEKLPAINTCFTPLLPDSRCLDFKLKKKTFFVEKRHLPPEFADTTSRAQEDSETDRGQGAKVNVAVEGGQRSKVKQASKGTIDF